MSDELCDLELFQGGFFCKLEGETNLNFIRGVVRKVVRGMDSIVAGPGGRGMRMRVEGAGRVCQFSLTGLFRTASVWLWLALWTRMDFSPSLSTPDSFPIFPYDNPYDIQLNLMQHLYRAIEDRAIAVVESPTGTVNCPKVHFNALTLTIFLQGKTASLLSATISWLLDDHERAKKG